jgi:hypothetical protein
LTQAESFTEIAEHQVGDLAELEAWQAQPLVEVWVVSDTTQWFRAMWTAKVCFLKARLRLFAAAKQIEVEFICNIMNGFCPADAVA